MASKRAMSSTAKGIFPRPRGMGYTMSWLSNAAKPQDKQQRQLNEHIAQLGLNQENSLRMQLQQPLFEYATIM
jgi:hypothetical protein